MYWYLSSTIFVFVSALGLISCGKADPVRDDWKPASPRAEWLENEDQKSIALLKTTDLKIPADAHFNMTDPTLAKWKVTSTCRGNDGAKPNIVETSKRSIDLRDLLPDSAWQKYDLAAADKLDCGFQFEVFNSRQSKWSFTVPSITIQNFERLESEDKPTPADEDTFDKDSKFTLVCEHFRSTWTTNTEITAFRALREITKSAANDLDALTFGQQKCRFLTEASNAEDEQARKVSKSFQHDFLPPKVEISGGLNLGGSVVANSQPYPQVLSFTVKNKSAVTVAYRLYDLRRENFALQLVVRRSPEALATEDDFKATLIYDLTGASKIVELGTDRIFEIAPGSTATLTAKIDSLRKCFDEPAHVSREAIRKQTQNNEITYVGYLYSFPSKRFVSRYINWSKDAPDFQGAVEDSGLLLASQPDFEGTYPGWAPYQGWVEQFGPQRPAIKSGGTPHTLPCLYRTFYTVGPPSDRMGTR